MRTRLLGCSMLLTAQLMAATATHAAEPCVFDKYAPAAVKPYSEEENLAYGTYSFMRGAQLYIPAQNGLTPEWLQTSIERAIMTRPGSPEASSQDPLSCSPNIKDVRVTVTSAGSGFWVTLIGRDQQSGEALVKWARRYVEHARAQARIGRATR
jgi:hypothetical protein